MSDTTIVPDSSSSKAEQRPNFGGLPTGLARFLETTKEAVPLEHLVTMEKDGQSWGPKPIVQRCHFCREVEESSCTILKRKEETALVWKLANSSKATIPASNE